MPMEHPEAEERGVWMTCPVGTPLYVQTAAGHYYLPELVADRTLVHVWDHDASELVRRGFVPVPEDQCPT